MTADLLADRPVFDAHVDSLQRALDLGHDLAEPGPGHLDLARGAAGGLGAVVLVAWIDPDAHGHAPRARAEALFGAAEALAARRPDRLRLVRDAAGLAAARADGAVAGVLGIEGGRAIEESLDVLAALAARGLRVLTLVWNDHLPWIRSCQPGAGAGVPDGLSAFGRDVVRAMGELGVVVDLSHAGERSFYDALEAGELPPIASHSGCKALHDHPRNLTDDQLRALAARGGVVGIAFCSAFLDAGARAAEAELRRGDAYRALGGDGPTGLQLARAEWMQRHAPPLAADRLVDHVLHAVEVAGVEHVGLGSDLDGIERAPDGLADPSGYRVIAERLRARGLAPDEVRLVLGGNLERVLARVARA